MERQLPQIALTENQWNKITGLIKHHLPNTEVWAYGSRVLGTAKPHSDLDLVAFARADQDLQVAALREAFADSDLPFRVDLFVWDELPESFQKTIAKERVILESAAVQ